MTDLAVAVPHGTSREHLQQRSGVKWNDTIIIFWSRPLCSLQRLRRLHIQKNVRNENAPQPCQRHGPSHRQVASRRRQSDSSQASKPASTIAQGFHGGTALRLLARALSLCSPIWKGRRSDTRVGFRRRRRHRRGHELLPRSRPRRSTRERRRMPGCRDEAAWLHHQWHIGRRGEGVR